MANNGPRLISKGVNAPQVAEDAPVTAAALADAPEVAARAVRSDLDEEAVYLIC